VNYLSKKKFINQDLACSANKKNLISQGLKHNLSNGQLREILTNKNVRRNKENKVKKYELLDHEDTVFEIMHKTGC
jgi:hypothetical protein